MAEEQEQKTRIWVSGCACCNCDTEDTDKVSLTFEIPGAKKDDIDLRVIPDGLRLVAKRDPTTEYVSEYSFMCSAEVDKVKASYADGVLEVEVPLTCKDPFTESPKIELS